MRPNRLIRFELFCLFLISGISCNAQTIWVTDSDADTITLYTYAGVPVKTISVQYPGGYPSNPTTECPRNAVETSDGSLWIYNGTFEPYISKLAADEQTWTHYAYGLFATEDNGTYGGIAVLGQNVFVTSDLAGYTAGLQYNTATGVAARIGGLASTALNIGQDGLLYLLNDGSTTVNVFNPTTLALVNQVLLTGSSETAFRGIIGLQNSHLIIGTLDGYVQEYNADGTLLRQILLTSTFQGTAASIYNVSLGTDGSYLVGSRFGDVFVVNSQLTSYTHFNVNRDEVFANAALFSVVGTNPLPAQTATVGVLFTLTLPASTFTEPSQGPALTYSASNLPPGFSFDPATETLYGIPTSPGSFAITVTATPTGNSFIGASVVINVAVAGARPLFYVANGNGNSVSAIASDGSVSTYATGLSVPIGIAMDTSGNLYTSDEGTSTISKIAPGGIVSTFATLGSTASLVGLAFDSSGNLYVADYNGNTVDRITPAGVVSIFASGLNNPGGIAFNKSGSLYVANEGDNTIAVVTPGGAVSTFATDFSTPSGVAFDTTGTLYVTNAGNSTILKVAPNGYVSQFSSTGLGLPIDVAFDSTGNLYATDLETNSILEFASGNSTPNTFASGLSGPAFLAAVPFVPLPSFTQGPASQTIATGRSVAFNVQITGAAAVTYQWTFNGVPISAATDPILLLSDATSANAGTYACFATTVAGSVSSTTATLNVIATSDPGYLDNLSARATVGSGANILIAGFAISGSGSMDLLLRGVGPALLPAPYSVSGAITTTQMTLYDSNSLGPFPIVTNAGWSNASTLGTSTVNVSPHSATLALMNTLGAFTVTWAAGSADSALEVTPPVGDYTSQISGVGGAAGIALAEVYDADSYTPATRLVNISSRAQVGTGGNILIGGFEIGGSTAETVLVRGVGPTLVTAPYNVPSSIAQPILTVYSGNTPLYSNTGWGGDSTIAGIFGTVGAFALNASSQDSALLITLPPGGYTAEVSGVNNTTGVALVEIYEVY
jgi:streptogramin lyase